MASDLSAFFSALARDIRGQLGGEALLEALQTGQSHLDLEIKAPVDSQQRFARLLELLDLADAFCQSERLLTLARTPEQVVFQNWLFGEFVRQADGADPMPWRDDRPAGLLASAVAELVEPVVVDPEVVGDLVHHRDPHLPDQLLRRRAHREQRPAEDRDPVRQARVVRRALGERDPLVEPQQVGLLGRWLVLDQDDDVVHLRGDLLGDLVEGLLHQGLERRPVELHAATLAAHRSLAPRAWARMTG